MRILVVEDEAAIATFVQQGLVEAGYAVDLASNGAEALEWVAIAPYDLIVLDLMLPDMDRHGRLRSAAPPQDLRTDPDVDRARHRR